MSCPTKKNTSTNPKCAKVACITNPCKNKRPPQTPDGFCMKYNNGETKAGIEGEERPSTSLEETASFHYDIGELHKKVRTLEAEIIQIKKTIYKIKEVIEYQHGSCEHSPFDE